MFIYKCGLLELGDGVTIGFNAPGGFYRNDEFLYPGIDCMNHPDSVWSNIVYLLANVTIQVELTRKLANVCLLQRTYS